ncbi:MAG: hypothetical protein C0595_10255 [Marinilabiliales bacterium]|nr:MAG: hypothetical protein C0595_10255 [Marinilabiliales bacterium]
MEKVTQPLSIRIIYWFTTVIFWLFSLVGLLAIIFAIGMITGLLDNLQLHVGIPVAIDIVEKGTLDLNLYSKYISVEFVDMIGKAHFVDTPLIIGQIYGVFMIIMVLFVFFIIWEFRLFISNIYQGKYFDYFNINHLKRISYTLVAIWVFVAIYGYFQYFFIVLNLNFETLEFTMNVQTYPSILMFALFIWVLSHIFMKGLELENENKLTI